MAELSTKIKITPDNGRILKYFYPISIILGTLILLGVLMFLYRNVYETLVQAELVNDLKTRVVQERLSIDKFNEVIGNRKNKLDCAMIEKKELRDPTVLAESTQDENEQ